MHSIWVTNGFTNVSFSPKPKKGKKKLAKGAPLHSASCPVDRSRKHAVKKIGTFVDSRLIDALMARDQALHFQDELEKARKAFTPVYP